MWIAQRSNPHQHVHRMPFFVPQLHFRFLRLAFLQGAADGAGCAASNTALTVTLLQNIVAAGTSHHLMPLVPGHPFCALVPKKNSPIPIGHRHSGLQSVQHGSKDLWILKFGHKRRGSTTHRQTWESTSDEDQQMTPVRLLLRRIVVYK